mmetsp:Transcript_30810/g.31311  ORF Transcript_30810/g.31311 Transcript_30810/m.31311 type:complete len:90 (+) Transcript_30810:726-995(+)
MNEDPTTQLASGECSGFSSSFFSSSPWKCKWKRHPCHVMFFSLDSRSWQGYEKRQQQQHQYNTNATSMFLRISQATNRILYCTTTRFIF